MVWCGGAPFSYNWEGTTLIADPQFWMFLDTIPLIMIQSLRHDSVIQGWSSPFHLFTLPDKPPTNCLFSELLIMLDFLGGPLRAAAFTTIHTAPPLRHRSESTSLFHLVAHLQANSDPSLIATSVSACHSCFGKHNAIIWRNIHLFKEKHINLDVDTLWISESTTYRQGQQWKPHWCTRCHTYILSNAKSWFPFADESIFKKPPCHLVHSIVRTAFPLPILDLQMLSKIIYEWHYKHLPDSLPLNFPQFSLNVPSHFRRDFHAPGPSPKTPHRLLPAFGLLTATQQCVHRDHVDALASTQFLIQLVRPPATIAFSWWT